MKAVAAGIVIAAVVARIGSAQDTVRIKAGAPAWGPRVTLEKLYTIGGPPDYILGVLYSTTMDKTGRVYAYDHQANVLKRYDAGGRYLGTIGRQGSGPGEYRTLIGIAIVHDSMLVGYDPSNGRFDYFRPDGTFDHQVRMPRSLSNWSGDLVSDSANAVYLLSYYIMGQDNRPITLAKRHWIRLDEQGQAVDSIIEPSFKETTDPVMRIVPPLGNNFVPEGRAMPTPVGGLVFGKGDSYRFGLLPMRGKPTIVEKDWTPVPLASGEYAEWKARLDYEHDHDPKHPSYNLPKSKPAYRGLTTDFDGRIWVDLYAPASKRDLPPRATPNPAPRIFWYQDNVYDVFDPAGKYLGRLTFPWSESFFKARGDRIWTRSKGPDDEELIIAYRVTGMPRR